MLEGSREELGAAFKLSLPPLEAVLPSRDTELPPRATTVPSRATHLPWCRAVGAPPASWCQHRAPHAIATPGGLGTAGTPSTGGGFATQTPCTAPGEHHHDGPGDAKLATRTLSQFGCAQGPPCSRPGAPQTLGLPVRVGASGGGFWGPRCPHGSFKKPTTSSRNELKVTAGNLRTWQRGGEGSGRREGGGKQPEIKPSSPPGSGDAAGGAARRGRSGVHSRGPTLGCPTPAPPGPSPQRPVPSHVPKAV